MLNWIVEVVQCKERKMYAVHNIWPGVLRLTAFSDFHHSKFQEEQEHFHDESIDALPVIIARKTGELLHTFTKLLNVKVLQTVGVLNEEDGTRPRVPHAIFLRFCTPLQTTNHTLYQ